MRTTSLLSLFSLSVLLLSSCGGDKFEAGDSTDASVDQGNDSQPDASPEDTSNPPADVSSDISEDVPPADVVAEPPADVVAEPLGAFLDFDRKEILFGVTWLFVDAPKETLRVLNTSATSKSSAIAIQLGDSSNFGIVEDNCTAKELLPKSSCTVIVTFHPREVGAVSTTLSAFASSGGSALSTLRGTGRTTLKLVKDSNMPWPAAIDINQVADAQFFLQSSGNDATGPLHFWVAPDGVPVTVDLGTCLSPLPANGSCHPHLKFAPTKSGTYTGTFYVSANPGGGSFAEFKFVAK